MKKLAYLVITIFCTVICACHKSVHTSFVEPTSVYFELVDQGGNGLVKSLKDSVKVSYMQAEVLKYHNLNVVKLQVAFNDTTTVKFYNGLVIDDNRFITDLSAYNVDPIHNFTMYINGEALGSLYFDYKNLILDNPVAAPTNSVTFNNIPCKLDASFKYFSPGIGIIVLPTQVTKVP